MAEEEKKPVTQTDPAAETKVEETKVEEKKETAPETTETLEEIQKEEVEKPTVGLDKYMSEKKARKSAEDRAEALALEIETLKADPAKSKTEIADDIAALAKEHNIDEEFLQKLATTVHAKAKKELEAEFLPKINKVNAENAAEKVEKKFTVLFDKTLDENPEYKGIVNRDVIKTLALDPKNAKKTLPQIVEETYGNAVTGKKTMETGPSGAKVEKPNFSKVTASDLERINSDPALKKEYTDWTQNEVKQYL